MKNQKKARVASLISDKIDFKVKKVTRDNEGYYIMIKWSTWEEDITIVNIYAPYIGSPQYIRQMIAAIKGEITVTQKYWGTLTLHLHQWTDHADRKSIGN